MTATHEVYSAIAAVQGELAAHGISKDSENTFDRYKFRGIDAVYNALSPLLAKHGLCVLPRIIERDCQERLSRKGDAMFYVTVTAEFDFVAAKDGSCHTVRTYGEAMDRSDKATNKAMSAAYKYAAFMTFAIPTEGDNDADASTPEIAGKPANDAKPAEQWTYTGPHKTKTAFEAAVKRVVHELNGCGDLDMLEAYLATDDAKATIAQCQKDRPDWFNGWEGQPDRFTPLGDLIASKRQELALGGDSIPDFIHEQAANVRGG